MVLPLAALAGSALSPLQGLGFGFGYGYGVRLGYHSFKPSKNQNTTNLRLSANPLDAGTGMGLASAEEMHENRKTPMNLTDTPTAVKDPNAGYFDQAEYRNPSTGMTQSREQIIHIGYKYGLSPRISLHRYQKGVYPFNKRH
jgi:hypothetical protein